jgi:hypothetical protein
MSQTCGEYGQESRARTTKVGKAKIPIFYAAYKMWASKPERGVGPMFVDLKFLSEVRKWFHSGAMVPGVNNETTNSEAD